MTTREIYRLAFNLLKRQPPPTAARYALKRAIIELGPSGHPFEKIVGEILKAQGYAVNIGALVKGHCVTHEVDVVAEKDNHIIMAECKFHHERGLKVDVKVALYVQARFEDIKKAWQTGAGESPEFNEAWLVTNAKLTSDAIQYAGCVGMKAVGWDYPQGESLAVLIERTGLVPITALTDLNITQKRQLTEKGIILCNELNSGALAGIGVAGHRAERVLKELEELCRKS